MNKNKKTNLVTLNNNVVKKNKNVKILSNVDQTKPDIKVKTNRTSAKKIILNYQDKNSDKDMLKDALKDTLKNTAIKNTQNVKKKTKSIKNKHDTFDNQPIDNQPIDKSLIFVDSEQQVSYERLEQLALEQLVSPPAPLGFGGMDDLTSFNHYLANLMLKHEALVELPCWQPLVRLPLLRTHVLKEQINEICLEFFNLNASEVQACNSETSSFESVQSILKFFTDLNEIKIDRSNNPTNLTKKSFQIDTVCFYQIELAKIIVLTINFNGKNSINVLAPFTIVQKDSQFEWDLNDNDKPKNQSSNQEDSFAPDLLDTNQLSDDENLIADSDIADQKDKIEDNKPAFGYD